jgi:transcriptional regulator with XRE-family HTH domain
MQRVTTAYVEREVARQMPGFEVRLGADVHRLRIDAGVTLAELGRAVGIDASHLGRIERGTASPSVDLLLRIGVALGADLSIRFFPGSGPRLRDRFQAPMVEALIRSLDPRWVPRPEVPILRPARGVIDIVLDDRRAPVTVATESCSDITRLEQLVRWSNEKAEGLARQLREAAPGDNERTVDRLLLVRSTARNREIARRYAATLAAAYPARTHDVVRALTTAEAAWPGSGIVWTGLDAGTPHILPFPPRGVDLGR